jgi:hypothetical protein
MKYGQLPVVIGNFAIDVKESMFYLYMPIKMAGNMDKIVLEKRLNIFKPLITAAIKDFKGDLINSYIYLTVKHLLVLPNYLGNRPGYHSDGFLTQDINYIWCDKNPTIFNNSVFDITLDDYLSLAEMEAQALKENEVKYPINSLLRLDQYNIHKVSEVENPMMRTFVKISISKDQYNLEGNSHNYNMDYEWDMKQRQESRNIPQSK